ncbi:ABC transporter permease [Burkholderia ubonensis]|nr:ABC transporter permease [Burkholderia ubonensis]KUZ25663.1 ABC transporter permease [Burkholderia ubonensis]KUZ26033.1 ABC transporter permease [Burkholderia ubonensis]KUZ27848.1 ABC transporter permease [Burkholderia ubonensis]KUZ57751.1 ABC transporter permease [Burkholderia ubonensis]
MYNPAVLVMGAGVVLPMIVLAVVSLSAPLDFGGVAWGDFTARAYERVVFDRDWDGSLVLQQGYLAIFARSMTMALLTTAGCLLIGFPTALFMATRSRKWKAALLILITIPFWTCVVVQMYGWIIVIADNGLLNQILSRAGLVQGTLGLLYTDLATVIGLVYAFTPFMILPIFAALDDFDWRLLEAAYDLGANKPAALAHVVVPCCRPGIMAGVGLVFVPALGSYTIPGLLGGNHAFMIGNLIDFQFAGGRDWPLGAAMSFVLLAVVLLAMLASRLSSLVQRQERVHEFA